MKKVKTKKKREYKFRKSSLKERKEFYKREFSISKVKKWFKSNNMPFPQLCAIDAGTESGIILKKNWKNIMFYFPFKDLKKKIKKYCPEDLYYDRSFYKNPKKVLNNLKFKWIKQELAFDIDGDNIECKCSGICKICIKKAYLYALKMSKKLKKIGFENIKLSYSGRGFHVHVLDKKAFSLLVKERIKLNKKFRKFPIDPWVSRGYIRLMRMPYSLHGLVSRICLPITKKFNIKKTIPKFLKN